MTENINLIRINKSKKSDNNTFICPIWKDKKNILLTIDLNNSVIIMKKCINGQNYIYIKNKKINNLFYDLNDKIVEIVKANCNTWFNNNMNVDLIDDYYINTLVYDKKYGDLIKLKCINDDIVKENVKCNITISLQHLRFYKQKFVLECNIDTFELIDEYLLEDDNNSLDEFFEEDELPQPTYEELENIKLEHTKKATNTLIKLKEEVSILEDLLIKLNESKTIESILKICDKLEFV
jgi:hypothetical protein